MDFDESRLYYSHQQLQVQQPAQTGAGGGGGAAEDGGNNSNTHTTISAVDLDDETNKIDLLAVRRHFREFLRNYRLGGGSSLSGRYIYRDRLLRMHRRLSVAVQQQQQQGGGSGNDMDPDGIAGQANDGAVAQNDGDGNSNARTMIVGKNVNVAKIEVDLAHMGEYDTAMLGYMLQQPATILPAMEAAAIDALKTLLYDERRMGRSAGSSDPDPDDGAMDDQSQQPGDHGSVGAGAGAAAILDLQSQQRRVDTAATEKLLAGIHIQILITGNLTTTPLRQIHASHMNQLIKCPGIMISSSPVKNRAICLKVRCHRCQDTRTVYCTEGPFSSMMLPSHCQGLGGTGDTEENGAASDCGRYPYIVVPDESQFIDQQTCKLQEAPSRVPTGEMPRSVLLTLERSLVDQAPPGTRVSVMCIPTLFTSGGGGGGGGNQSKSASTKQVYLRVVGMQRENDTHGSDAIQFTPVEEEAFRTLSRHPEVYEILSRSIAPNISGSYTVDIKKALTCQLLGGSRKRLPDGCRLRGDINVLLLGDPSMAKSQFLKFVAKVAPVGIYTSGKGSSAAGLTASVVRDAKGEFYLEGGAMVLADGGIVCIDEFDKMRPADRVAIHEAMEQQTISIAKAGITTVLNSRSSVLAAANPVFGRYDDYKSASENIDLMTTILSRFDLIFLVRDIREEERDRLICQHVMGVHIASSTSYNSTNQHRRGGGGGGGNHAGSASMASYMAPPGAASGNDDPIDGGDGGSSNNTPEAIAENVMRVATTGQGELDVAAMKKYIQYCKSKCSPRLSEQAGDVLTSAYVKIRDDVRKQAISASGRSSGPEEDTQAAIPITVRQLEALVRLSESLAKMRLDTDVQSEDVTEALRLFKVSTMAANAADQNNLADTALVSSLSGANREEMQRTESFLRTRLTMGMMINKQKLIEEAAGQGFNAVLVTRALSVMTSRGELLERNQGRLLKRIK